jgi:uncharacterized protein (TIGR00369 family)
MAHEVVRIEAMTAPQPFPVPIPFIESQGFELLRFDGGVAEIALNLKPEQMNSWQIAHGGLLMTLLDVAMAHAARSPHAGVADDPAIGIATIEMKTSFLQPAEGRLMAQGRLLHRTRTIAFCEGDVRDDQGRVCAHATGTFKYLRTLAGRERMPPRTGGSD